jgi:NitT/TauT family transport system substrate-binding protein
MRSMLVRALGVVMALSLLAGCGSSATSDSTNTTGNATTGTTTAETKEAPKELKKVTLMLNWIPYGEHAPFYYGVEKGFFKEEGIDLTIQPGGGSGKTVQAVGAKQVDFGWADTPALINGIAAGVPVKSIGVFLQTTPSSFEFFTEKNIKTLQDLKGKSIGASAGDAPLQALPALLGANGMTMEDVKIVNVTPAGKLAALIEGQVDVIIGFAHDQAPTIEDKAGKPVSVLRYSDYGVNFLSNGLLAHTDTLKNDPELVKAFLRAAIKSWEEAAKDQQAAVEIMAKHAEKAPPVGVMAKQLAMTMEILHTKNTEGKRPGINAEADWQTTIDVMAKYAGLQNPGQPSTYWDGSFAPN